MREGTGPLVWSEESYYIFFAPAAVTTEFWPDFHQRETIPQAHPQFGQVQARPVLAPTTPGTGSSRSHRVIHMREGYSFKLDVLHGRHGNAYRLCISTG
jgi:hypothetical protein